MAGVGRPRLAAEADRRVAERRARIGAQVREARGRRGWSQLEVARRAGLGRLVVGRIERGIVPLDVDGLERISAALGVALIVQFGRDLIEDVADAGHLAIQELVLTTAKAAGFNASFELPTRPAESWRSVDAGLANDARRILIAAECWNTIGDIGAAARASSRKLADLEAMAAGRWEGDARVGVVWIVRATARNRGLVARYPAVFEARFRGSSNGWLETLRNGSEPPAEPGLVWCDVAATRLFAWRRPG